MTTATSDIEATWHSVRKLIRQWARQYMGSNTQTRLYELADLEQAGFLALYEAIQAHDPERGSLNTMLRFYCLRHFAAVSGYGRNQHKPETNALSLDAPLSNADGDLTLADTLQDPGAAFADDLIDRIASDQDAARMLAEIAKLPKPEREALTLATLGGKTIAQVADAMNLPEHKARYYRYGAVKMLEKTRAYKEIKKGREDDARYRARHVTLSEYLSTWTSEVEKHVLYLERSGDHEREQACI